MARQLLVILLTLVTAGSAAAQLTQDDLGAEVRVLLENGDVVTGELVAVDDVSFTLRHPIMGDLTVPFAALAPPVIPVPDPSILLAEPEPEPPPPGPWTHDVFVGLNGSSGNTENSRYRVEHTTNYETPESTWLLNYLFRYAKEETDDSGSNVTEDQHTLSTRYEWLQPESPWRTYVQGSADKDRFKDWDYRYRIGAGKGYTFRDDDVVTLIGRAGLGFVRTVGGEEDGTETEAQLGVDYDHVLTERSKFTSAVYVFPSLTNSGEYRSLGRAAFEQALNETQELLLKLGVDYEYDSNPGDADSTDWNYFASLGWRF